MAVQSSEQSDTSFFFQEVLHVQAVITWLLSKCVSLNNLCSTCPFLLVLFFLQAVRAVLFHPTVTTKIFI